MVDLVSYPVGTDLITEYIGRDENGKGLFTAGKYIDTNGDYVDNASFAASDVYIPINPSYRYYKTKTKSISGRIYSLVWYDENFNKISRLVESNLNEKPLPAPPSNARYFRFSTLNNSNNWTIAITRIAPGPDLISARRKIILSQPHIKTLSAPGLVTFNTDISANLKDCKIYFEPVQEGSGDPSPDNVRPISGWDGAELHINNTSLTIPFPQTIYGGYVDLVNGEVVEEYYKFTLDGTTYYLSQAQALNANNMAMAYGVIGKNNGLLDLPVGYRNHNLYMVDSMPNYDNSGATSDKEGVFCGSGDPYVRVILDPSKLSDISSRTAIRDSINGWLNDNPIGICYELATPIHHTIDPQVIRPLKGVNNIWSNANGNIEIKFWKH